MAGECSASPGATAPAQSCVGASAGEEVSNQDAQDATLPKTTGRDPMGVDPNVALATGRDRSSVPTPAGAPATPTPQTEMPDAARGSAESLRCSRRFGLTAPRSARSSQTRSNGHHRNQPRPTSEANRSGAEQSNAAWLQEGRESYERWHQALSREPYGEGTVP